MKTDFVKSNKCRGRKMAVAEIVYILATLCMLLYTLGASAHSLTGTVIKAADYGIKPGTGKDLTKAIQQLFNKSKEKQAPITIIFEPGQYDLYYNSASRAAYYISNTSGKEEEASKVKIIGIWLKGFHNLTIDGKGALFMLHGKMTSLIADNCKDLRIQNLQFDYARPTMSEFTVTAVKPDYIDVKINPDSWYRIKDSMLYWYGENWDGEKTPLRLHTCKYDPRDSALHFVDAGWDKFTKGNQVVELSKNHVRFYHPGPLNTKIGDVYTTRDITRDEVGMHFVHSSNILMDSVQMHFMHGLGIISQFCTDIHFNHLVCAPRSETGRICSSTADMAHFSGCNGTVTVENSFFSGGHDDPINIHGTHLRIVKQLAGHRVVLRFMHHQTYGIQAYEKGDTVDFISAKTLLPYASSVVEGYKKLDEYDIELQLKGSLPVKIDSLDCLENATRTPKVVIRHNWFQRTTTRGLLVTTRRKVLIENNTWFKTGMSAILIADDANNWFESGMVRDVTIRDNKFVNCGLPVINIAPENQVSVPGKAVHHNIRITGNTFERENAPVVAARSVDGLLFENNKIRHYGPDQNRAPVHLLSLEDCSSVVITGNTVPKGLVPSVQVSKMKGSKGSGDIKSDWKMKFK